MKKMTTKGYNNTMKKLIDWLFGSDPWDSDSESFGAKLTGFQKDLWENRYDYPQWSYLGSIIEKKKSRFRKLPKGAYGKL